MSYILEALRRAQAERERGLVPGLQAQAVVQAEPEAPARRWLPAVGAGVGVVALGLGAWWLMRPGAPAPVLAPVVAVAPAGPASAVVAPAIVVVSAQPQSAQAPAVVPVPPPPPPPLPSQHKGAEPAVAPPRVASEAAAAAPRSVAWGQLSAAQRSQLPAMNLGGAIWSESAASRFVIVNGQVLREGDAVAAGLLLERIDRKAIWLRWRDLRIELPL